VARGMSPEAKLAPKQRNAMRRAEAIGDRKLGFPLGIRRW
jgi:hypothetical protein